MSGEYFLKRPIFWTRSKKGNSSDTPSSLWDSINQLSHFPGRGNGLLAEAECHNEDGVSEWLRKEALRAYMMIDLNIFHSCMNGNLILF